MTDRMLDGVTETVLKPSDGIAPARREPRPVRIDTPSAIRRGPAAPVANASMVGNMNPDAAMIARQRTSGLPTTAAPAAAQARMVPQRPAQPSRDLALGAAELRGILRVVEDCERAPTLPAFRETTLDSLTRHLGYRNSAFFLGSSLEAAFQDPRPAGRGLALRMAGPFLERYRGLEAFSDPESLRLMWERGLVTLEDIGNPARPEIRLRMERFLRAHGINSKLMVRLAGPSNLGAVISLLDPRPGAFGPRDRAIASVLGRHLGNLLRFHVRTATGPP